MSEDKLKDGPTETITLVYVGQRVGKGGKLIRLWLQVSEQEADDGVVPSKQELDPCYRVYDGKGCVRYMTGGVGAVYRVSQIVGTSQIYSHDAKYAGLWPDDVQRMDWQLCDRMERTVHGLARQQKKEVGGDLFLTLRPIRERYGRLVSQDQRAALLAQIVAFITR